MTLDGDGNRAIRCPPRPIRCLLGAEAILRRLRQHLADFHEGIGGVVEAGQRALQPAAELGVIEGDGDAGHLGHGAFWEFWRWCRVIDHDFRDAPAISVDL